MLQDLSNEDKVIENRNNLKKYFIIFIIFILIISNKTFAKGKIGSLNWLASIKMTGTYDDNIDPYIDYNMGDTEIVEKSDFIFEISPSLSLVYNKKRLYTSFNAGLNGYLFTKHQKRNDLLYQLGILTGYKLSKNFSLIGGNNFNKTSYRIDIDKESPVSSIQSDTLFISPAFKYNFHPKFKESEIRDILSATFYLRNLQLPDYENKKEFPSYEVDPLTNYVKNTLYLRFFKLSYSRLTIFPNFLWKYNHYIEDKFFNIDNQIFYGNLGSNIFLTKRLNLYLELGYEYLIYSENEDNSLENDGQLSGKLEIKYNLTKRSNFFFNYYFSYIVTSDPIDYKKPITENLTYEDESKMYEYLSKEEVSNATEEYVPSTETTPLFPHSQHNISCGINYNLTRKLESVIKIGFNNYSFIQGVSKELAQLEKDDKNKVHLDGSFSLFYNFNKQIKGLLRYSMNFNDSYFKLYKDVETKRPSYEVYDSWQHRLSLGGIYYF